MVYKLSSIQLRTRTIHRGPRTRRDRDSSTSSSSSDTVAFKEWSECNQTTFNYRETSCCGSLRCDAWMKEHSECGFCRPGAPKMRKDSSRPMMIREQNRHRSTWSFAISILSEFFTIAYFIIRGAIDLFPIRSIWEKSCSMFTTIKTWVRKHTADLLSVIATASIAWNTEYVQFCSSIGTAIGLWLLNLALYK